MMNAIGNVINQIDSLVWGWWMIILLLGTHIFMTIRTGVIQRKIGTAIRLSVTKDTDSEGEVSQFGALTTALASTIGTVSYTHLDVYKRQGMYHRQRLPH